MDLYLSAKTLMHSPHPSQRRNLEHEVTHLKGLLTDAEKEAEKLRLAAQQQ